MKREGKPNFVIPSTLRCQLLQFRKQLWSIKILEAFGFAAIGLLAGFLATYCLDRFLDTALWIRYSLLTASAVTFTAIPFAIKRWVWGRRRFEQLAALLARMRPAVGDQILGVLDLVSDRGEQKRSPELVDAAIQQVAGQISERDLSNCLPPARIKQRGIFVASFLVVSAFLFAISSEAASSSLNRFLRPWLNVQRYTFAQIRPIQSPIIVPKGEQITFEAELASSSPWKPNSAKLHLASRVPYEANNQDGQFRFQLPGQVLSTTIDFAVGDYRSTYLIKPIDRPELTSLVASIKLPEYLGRNGIENFEVRGTTLSVLEGSMLTLSAEATRALSKATINEKSVPVEETHFKLPELTVIESQDVSIDWQDRYGLSATKPTEIRLESREDEHPSLLCENLPLRKVLLTSEVLSFQIRAYDDFGVKKVGLEWSRVAEDEIEQKLGDTVLGAGGPEETSLLLEATFSGLEFKLEPSTILLKAFVEDYHPEHPREYSSPCYLQLLDNAQHAIWVTSELSRWQQMSLDVRDRELQLHQANLALRELPSEELNTTETKELITKHAERERANGRQLANLVRTGNGLVREAMRNKDIDADYLENLAQMVQVLEEISNNRMPEVAELLEKAAEGHPIGQTSGNDSTKVGKNRLEQPKGESKDGQEPEHSDEKPSTPSVSDIESSQLDLEKLPKAESQKQKPQQGRLGLADTKLAGNAPSESKATPPQEELEAAILEQEDLLEEFEKVSDAMNKIMGNLEGSTLVKRLKSASRRQQQVASGLTALVANSFGVPEREKHADREAFLSLSDLETRASGEISDLMDDMTAYYQRSGLPLLQRVLEQMKAEDVTAGLRELGLELREENGLSISQAEYWSDNLDRWAEDLVEVTQSGASPGGKPKGSLPPSVVLEVLQLLDDEVQLREQTRVAEQKRPVVTDTDHLNDATRLAELQQAYQQRVEKVVDQILTLPNAEGDFANELNMLAQVAGVMQETTEILYKPQTGPPAIAAETEIIELLLKSKRFNPNASGGSGADPGGGGNGDTEVSALALVGAGINAKEIREESEVTTSTGLTSPGLPEEFRGGLDQYFNRLEEWKSK